MKGIIAILLLTAVSASAETRPETKPDTTIHFADYLGYAGIAGYRTLDYLSTERALGYGYRELELPKFVVATPGRLAAFEGVATAVEVGSSVWLVRHHHRKLARAANVMSIAAGSASVSINYSHGRRR